MSWTKHINGATSRANRILGLTRRNLREASHKIKEKAYLSLVHPHVEYCSTIWNPHSKKDIARIEHIQRQAARFVLCRYRHQESVTTMLQELQWPSLEDRRRISSLHLMYKIRHQIVAVNPDLYLTPMAPSSTRSYHPKQVPIHTNLYSALQILLLPSHSCLVEHSPWKHLIITIIRGVQVSSSSSQTLSFMVLFTCTGIYWHTCTPSPHMHN